jgi:M6 family metalloprotease-like protein
LTIRVLGIAFGVLGIGAAQLLAQGDVEALGRELGGAKPPVEFYQFLALNPNAFQFSPDNGWIRRARAIAAQRAAARSLAASGAVGVERASRDANGVLVGDLNIPVFLILYANTDSGTVVSNMPRAVMEQRLYSTDPAPPYSINTYYREISGDRLIVNGTVFDWARVSQNDTQYEGGCNGLCPAGSVEELIEEMVQFHDPNVDFGQFDNDGADGIPNSGDDDGFVDGIVLLHPEVDGACRAVNPGATENIWAHRATYRTWTGTDLRTADLSANGDTILVRDYIIQGGQGGDGGCTDDEPQAMGVVAHESGHLLGLPDLYNTNSLRNSEGIGHWGLMGSGNWRTPTSPAHMEAWSRAELGWVTEVLIDRDTSLVVGPVADSDTAFVVPIANTDEYFLLENRQPIGSDAQQRGPGLLIWHVDSALVAQRAAANQVNAFDPEAIRLEQADGRGDLQAGAGRSDAGDPFPGTTGSTVFGHNTNPSSARNDGTQTFVIIDSIAQEVPGGAMSLRIRFGAPTLIAATDTLAAFRLDGVVWNRFNDVLESGTDHDLDMDSLQVTADGRTRYTWVAWSTSQPRTHTFTSSPEGDTVIATVDTEFLLRVAMQGTGGVVSTAPVLDVISGEFVTQDEVVTLVGEASEPGKVFDGWSGDRMALTDTLVLTMDQPYDLTATFVDELVVTAPEIPPLIMGSQVRFDFTASGGDGTLAWQQTAGVLPAGMSFLSTGVLSGRPTELGEFDIAVQARSSSQTVTVPVQLNVVAPALAADDVVSHLVGAGSLLSAEEISFLDFLGNGNGRFDVGDFLAWVSQPGVAVSPELMARVVAREGR